MDRTIEEVKKEMDTKCASKTPITRNDLQSLLSQQERKAQRIASKTMFGNKYMKIESKAKSLKL